MNAYGNVPAGIVLYIPFNTYESNGASITITGLAVTDIEIYKNGSTTQRASDNGYALLDSDGIDFDGITGIHGFSVDTGDNSDAGFYSAGGQYWVVVSAVTLNGQTSNFVAATFRIEPAAGVNANVVSNAGTAITAASGIQEVKVASIAANAITATAIASDAITDAKVASDVTIASVTGAVGSVTGAVGSVTGLTAADVGAIKAKTDNLPGDPADASDIAGAFGTVNGTLGTIAGYIDTEVGAIKTVVDAVKAKTDSLTFTVAGKVDANTHRVNNVAVTGVGTSVDPWGPA